jgi:glycosyltransferase involved in cell wall biosynthesis
MTRATTPRRVALIAYFYPPLGGVAVARTLGFVRHLPEAGWTPVVIAPQRSTYPLRDERLVADERRDVEVHRALSPEPGHLAKAARRALAVARGARGSASVPSAAAAGTADAVGAVASSTTVGASSAAAGTVGRLGPWPGRLRRLVWFPDDQVGWLPFAVTSLVIAHRRAPVDAVVSSASPVTAHVAAWIGSRLIGVPWVADFRDPWLDNPLEPMTGFARWRRATLEHAIVRGAACSTFATRGLRNTYAQRYPRLAGRFSVLPNGYERAPGGVTTVEADASPATPLRRDGPVRLVYAGSLYRPSELDTFLAGVALFADARADATTRLEVTFIGTATDECRVVADRWRADARVAPLVRFGGFVPRSEAVEAIAGADAALTLLGGGPGMAVFVGAKLYDYLALDKQVLAMVPPGDARDVLAELDWGIIADPEPDAVAAALGRLVDEPPPTRRADPQGRYDRARVAGRLGALLDALVDAGSAGSARTAGTAQ